MTTETKGRKCDGKVRYPTREKALAAIRRRIAEGAASNALNAYPCEHCGSFHVGHRPGRTGRRKRT